jgi:hypothetical protein
MGVTTVVVMAGGGALDRQTKAGAFRPRFFLGELEECSLCRSGGKKKKWIFSEKSKEAERIGTGCLKLPPIKRGASESQSLSLPPRFSCKQNKLFQNLRPPSHFDSLCGRAYI